MQARSIKPAAQATHKRGPRLPEASRFWRFRLNLPSPGQVRAKYGPSLIDGRPVRHGLEPCHRTASRGDHAEVAAVSCQQQCRGIRIAVLIAKTLRKPDPLHCRGHDA